MQIADPQYFNILLYPLSQLILLNHQGKRQGMRDLNKKAKKDKTFTFDNVYGPDSTNEEVWRVSAQRYSQYIVLLSTAWNVFF